MAKTDPHTSRREFVVAASTGLAAATVGRDALQAPQVLATVTPYYRHPGADRTLVRFVATGSNSPAGRLRVYDRQRQLLGTAGMLGTGSALLGELWLPVSRPTTVTSHLEAPGLRGIHRTAHRLTPAPRWTVYWVPVVEPDAIDAELRNADPLMRSVRAGVLREIGVVVNPRATATDGLHDHVAFLQQARRAGDVERAYGIPVSALAWIAASHPPANVLTALAGSGVRTVAHPGDGAVEQIVNAGSGASLLAITIPPPGWGAGSGLERDVAAMEEQLGSWLTRRSESVATEERSTIVVSTDLESVVRARTNVDEWNRRYAFPHIVTEAPEVRSFPSAQVLEHAAPQSFGVPTRQGRMEAASRAAEGRQRHMDNLFTPLATLLPGAGSALSVVAHAVGSALPGTVVFNPSPFARTDYVELPDGRLRLATDIPPLGYAFLVDVPGESSPERERELVAARTIRTDQLAISLDAESGAISSVKDADGAEWVGRSLNEIPNATVSQVSVSEIPGFGKRLVVHRDAPGYGAVRSVVTIYDTLPWLDIENTSNAGAGGLSDYAFSFSSQLERVVWEVPGGIEAWEAPLEGMRHLRWLHLVGEGNVFFRAVDAPAFSVSASGELVSHAPPRRSRYRLASDTLPATARDAARVGWSAEPLVALSVPGGNGTLPRWGSLFQLDQPGAAIVGVTDVDGDGMTVFVQELGGIPRNVSLTGELIRFSTAELVDFTGRPEAGQSRQDGNTVSFALRRHGFAAVRLGELSLARVERP